VAGELTRLTGIETVEPAARARGVRLEIEPLPLHELPWELMRATATGELLALHGSPPLLYRAGTTRTADTFAVRWMQRALRIATHVSLFADGIAGPQTGAALRAFQDAAGIVVSGVLDELSRKALEARVRDELAHRRDRRPRIAILRPSREQAEQAFGGTESAVANAESAYARAGDVVVIEGPGMLRKTGLAGAAVVHVTGRFHESSTRGGIAVEFGGSPDEALTVSHLDDAFRSAAVPPLVVLDAPRAEGPAETLRQLFARNAFAADLFARRTVATVLAAGLGDYAQQRLLFDTLAALLDQHATVAEIALEIRRMGAPASEVATVLATVGTALFTHDPDQRPLLDGPPG
jgi:peptidoglycan hydrolase-like protein with peptidoglycan-binding domain